MKNQSERSQGLGPTSIVLSQKIPVADVTPRTVRQRKVTVRRNSIVHTRTGRPPTTGTTTPVSVTVEREETPVEATPPTDVPRTDDGTTDRAVTLAKAFTTITELMRLVPITGPAWEGDTPPTSAVPELGRESLAEA